MLSYLLDGLRRESVVSRTRYFMRSILLFLLFISAPLAGVRAAVIDLYSGEVTVESQDARERREAIPLALKHVLQKLSGLRHFDDYPLVEPALANAQSMLLSFHYRNVETALADGEIRDELVLVASFEATRVDELARSLLLPIWQVERSPTDIWVVVDDGLDRRVMPIEFQYAWESMENAATLRGLPVNWPEPDEEGNFQVDAQLLWGGYTEDLGDSRGRGVLIAAARREGPEWSVRLNLEYHDVNWAWRLQDIDLQAVLTESMQQAVDQIAAANTIAASDLGAWLQEITVTGLSSADAYRSCLGNLQQISVVDHVAVLAARGGTVTFKLELSALPQYLEEALVGSRYFEFDESSGSYQLMPESGNRLEGN